MVKKLNLCYLFFAMCFHSQLTSDAQKLEKRYKAKFPSKDNYHTKERISGFEFGNQPILANNEENTLQLAHWGLVPKSSSSLEIRKVTLNARQETLHIKNAFKHSLNSRCLVPLTAFYEWKWLDPRGKNKVQFEINLKGEEIFSVAGLWDEYTIRSTGEVYRSFTIITTAANELMSEIHNTKKRMPLAILPKFENDWLKGEPLESFLNLEIDWQAKALQNGSWLEQKTLF